MRIAIVVPYIGTWIETISAFILLEDDVVPYIGTWIETEDTDKLSDIP